MADFVIEVKANTRQAGSNLDRLNQKLRRTEGVAGTVAKRLRSMLGVLVGGAAFGAAIRQISQFQDSMARVGTTTGATTNQLNRMRDAARRLGRETRFTGSEAADGLRLLAQAGLDADESVAALEATLNLAQAAMISVGEAADIATNVMSGFGQDVRDLEDVMDVLVGTANRSNTNVSQLGQAMSFVAPIARSLGIDIETASAAIGTLGDNGIQATRAATGMRGVMAALSNPVGAAADELARLGLSASDVNIQARGLIPVLETLQAAGLTGAGAYRLFGREAATAALVLVEGNERLAELRGELLGVQGESARAAAAVKDTLGGAFGELLSAVNDLLLGLGGGPAGKGLAFAVRSLAGGVRFLSDAMLALGLVAGVYLVRAFLRFQPAALSIGESMAGNAAVVEKATKSIAGRMLAFVGFSRAWVTRLAPILTSPFTGLLALVSPGGAVLTAFVLFAAAFTRNYADTQNWAAALGRTFRDIADFILEWAMLVRNIFDGVMAFLRDPSILINALDGSVTRFRDAIAGFFNNIGRDFALGFGQAEVFTRAFPTGPRTRGNRGRGLEEQTTTENLEALERQAALLEEIQGPIRDYRTELADLEELRANDLITQRQYIVEYERLMEAIKNARGQTQAEIEVEKALNDERTKSERLVRSLRGPSEDYLDTQRRLERLFFDGAITLDQYNQGAEENLRTLNDATGVTAQLAEEERLLNDAYREESRLLDELISKRDAAVQAILDLSPSQVFGQINTGSFGEQGTGFGLQQGTFFSGFAQEIAASLEQLRSFAVEAGAIFGRVALSMANTIGREITNLIQGTVSLKDAIANVAASVVGQLITAFVKLGIQFLLNHLLSQKILSITTAAQVTQAALVAEAWAAAAANVSLATFGANAGPASAGILATHGLVQGLSVGFGDPSSFAQGGYVFGPGGQRDDRVYARLSPGEFVVNAQATQQNRDTLERINRGEGEEQRPIVVNIGPVYANDANSFRSDRQLARDLARGIRAAEQG